jgi:outer membrane lipoprotein LolB
MPVVHPAVITINKHKVCASLLMISLFLSACAQQPVAPVPDPDRYVQWESHLNSIGDLKIWTLTGRMSVQMENDNWSASVHWEQNNDDYRLRIIAPFGRSTVQISGNTDSVALTTADNQVFEDDDVDVLIRQNLGWDIPVAALAYWIKGLPEQTAETQTLVIDDMGRATDLSQSGWRIQYERYTNSSGYEMPLRITLQREGLQLRLIINKWEIPT